MQSHFAFVRYFTRLELAPAFKSVTFAETRHIYVSASDRTEDSKRISTEGKNGLRNDGIGKDY